MDKGKRVSRRSGYVRVAAVLLLVLFSSAIDVCAVDSQKPRFYIKIKGIGTNATGGNYGDFVDLTESYFTGLNDPSQGYNIALTKAPYFKGYGGEIGFETKKYAVGISGGYIEKNLQIDYSFVDPVTGEGNSYIRDHKYSAIPIFIFVHYKLIDTRFLNAFLTLGEGVYLTTYRDDVNQTFSNQELTYSTSYVESKKNHIGFHLGTTLDFKISKNLAFFVEAAYRIAKFKSMEAEDYYIDDEGEIGPTEGEFYYWTNSETGESRLTIGAPSSKKTEWEGLPTEFNLDGFSLSVGIKITFGSGKKKETVKIAPLD
jgi:hypothetical protein